MTDKQTQSNTYSKDNQIYELSSKDNRPSNGHITSPAKVKHQQK